MIGQSLYDINMNEYTFHIPPPCDEAVGIVYADEHILVVNKPSGLLSVPGRVVKDCVLSRVAFDYPDARIVHRLDLDTSGLLVLAIGQQATSDLNRQFRDRLIGKQYEAVVFGELLDDTGEINAAIAQDWERRPRQKIDAERGKHALTKFKVLTRQDHTSRVALEPVTGRSHQLRIHLAHIGHPILGCDLYAHDEALAASDRLMLHAAELSLFHPLTEKRMTFSSAVPF